jgi:hypothetical protein
VGVGGLAPLLAERTTWISIDPGGQARIRARIAWDSRPIRKYKHNTSE